MFVSLLNNPRCSEKSDRKKTKKRDSVLFRVTILSYRTQI